MPPPPGYPAPAYQQPGAGYQPSMPTRYGGFWIRFVAIFIDGIIVAIPILIIAFILGVILGVMYAASGNTSTSGNNAATTGVGTVAELIALVIEVAYFVYFWSRGQTLAMRLFNLKIVDANTGAPIGVGRAAIRFIGYVISAAVCYIGLIWAAFDARKQGWHDKMANTVVIQA